MDVLYDGRNVVCVCRMVCPAGKAVAVHHVHKRCRAVQLHSIICREGKQVRKIIRVCNIHSACCIVHAVIIVAACCGELFLVFVACPDFVEKIQRLLRTLGILCAAFCRRCVFLGGLTYAKFIVEHAVIRLSCIFIVCGLFRRSVRLFSGCFRLGGHLLRGRGFFFTDGIVCFLACAGCKAQNAGKCKKHC